MENPKAQPAAQPSNQEKDPDEWVTGDVLRSAAAIIDQKAPADAAAYKAWLLHIASNVAEASKEGVFLGFGGVAVSAAEKATLSEIATALETRV